MNATFKGATGPAPTRQSRAIRETMNSSRTKRGQARGDMGTLAVEALARRWKMDRTALAAVFTRQETEARQDGRPPGRTPIPELAESVRLSWETLLVTAARTPAEAAVKISVAVMLLDEQGIDGGGARNMLMAVMSDLEAMRHVTAALATVIA